MSFVSLIYDKVRIIIEIPVTNWQSMYIYDISFYMTNFDFYELFFLSLYLVVFIFAIGSILFRCIGYRSYNTFIKELSGNLLPFLTAPLEMVALIT